MGAWHLEVHELDFILTDAAGQISSNTVPLDRPGAVLGVAFAGQNKIGNNDNGHAVGYVGIFTGTLTEIILGARITSIQGQLSKVLGTSGNVTISYRVLVFIRDARGS